MRVQYLFFFLLAVCSSVNNMDWSSLLGENIRFVGKALDTPIGNFPYSLTLNSNKTILSTGESTIGYHKFILTETGLRFQFKLAGIETILSGCLEKVDFYSNEVVWMFSGLVYGQKTQIIFMVMYDNLLINCYRNNTEHAQVYLKAVKLEKNLLQEL